MTKNDQQNPKKIGEHATNGINAKKEEERMKMQKPSKTPTR